MKQNFAITNGVFVLFNIYYDDVRTECTLIISSKNKIMICY